MTNKSTMRNILSLMESTNDHTSEVFDDNINEKSGYTASEIFKSAAATAKDHILGDVFGATGASGRNSRRYVFDTLVKGYRRFLQQAKQQQTYDTLQHFLGQNGFNDEDISSIFDRDDNGENAPNENNSDGEKEGQDEKSPVLKPKVSTPEDRMASSDPKNILWRFCMFGKGREDTIEKSEQYYQNILNEIGKDINLNKIKDPSDPHVVQIFKSLGIETNRLPTTPHELALYRHFRSDPHVEDPEKEIKTYSTLMVDKSGNIDKEKAQKILDSLGIKIDPKFNNIQNQAGQQKQHVNSNERRTRYYENFKTAGFEGIPSIHSIDEKIKETSNELKTNNSTELQKKFKLLTTLKKGYGIFKSDYESKLRSLGFKTLPSENEIHASLEKRLAQIKDQGNIESDPRIKALNFLKQNYKSYQSSNAQPNNQQNVHQNEPHNTQQAPDGDSKNNQTTTNQNTTKQNVAKKPQPSKQPASKPNVTPDQEKMRREKERLRSQTRRNKAKQNQQNPQGQGQGKQLIQNSSNPRPTRPPFPFAGSYEVKKDVKRESVMTNSDFISEVKAYALSLYNDEILENFENIDFHTLENIILPKLGYNATLTEGSWVIFERPLMEDAVIDNKTADEIFQKAITYAFMQNKIRFLAKRGHDGSEKKVMVIGKSGTGTNGEVVDYDDYVNFGRNGSNPTNKKAESPVITRMVQFIMSKHHIDLKSLTNIAGSLENYNTINDSHRRSTIVDNIIDHKSKEICILVGSDICYYVLKLGKYMSYSNSLKSIITKCGYTFDYAYDIADIIDKNQKNTKDQNNDIKALLNQENTTLSVVSLVVGADAIYHATKYLNRDNDTRHSNDSGESNAKDM